MISSSLHPGPVHAVCERRRRWSFGLTGRSIGLLTAGFLLLLPGFWDARLSYAMLVWDVLVLVAAFLDGVRLPAVSQLGATRTWSNAPALDSETEIELTLENQGRTIVNCRLVDDLPAGAGGRSSGAPAHGFSPRAGAPSLSRRTPGTRRLRNRLALRSLSFAPGTRRALGQGQTHPDRPRLSGVAHHRGAADLPGPQPPDRSPTPPGAPARSGPRLRKPARIPRRRRPARHLLDRHGAARQPHHPPVPDRAQPAGVDRPRLRPPDALASCRSCPAVIGTTRLAGPRVHSKLDHACSTAVALAQLALYSGDRVGLLAYGQGIQQRLLPGRGSDHLRQLIELLAQVHSESSEADHLRATTVLNRLQPRRSLILWVTDLAESAMRPEVIDGAVQLLRRHVLLFVAMAQPEVEAHRPRPAQKRGADVPLRRSPGDGRPPRTPARPPPRAGRAHPRPQSRGAHVVGAESVPGGEGESHGLARISHLDPLGAVRASRFVARG